MHDFKVGDSVMFKEGREYDGQVVKLGVKNKNIVKVEVYDWDKEEFYYVWMHKAELTYQGSGEWNPA